MVPGESYMRQTKRPLRAFLIAGACVLKIDPATGATVAAFGPPGNALGIAVNPKDTKHIIYAGRDCRAGVLGPTCTLYDLDLNSGKAKVLETYPSTLIGYVGGI